MRFGDLATNVPVFAERYVQTYVNASLTTRNYTYTINVGSFTMPFTGSATANFIFRYHWGTDQQAIHSSIASSSVPAPADTVVTYYEDDIPGASFNNMVDVPTYARWANLSQGQTVTMHASVYVGLGFALPLFEWSLALVRMQHGLAVPP